MALRKGILGGVPTTTLAGSINNVVTSLTITDATGWAMATPFVITVEPDTTNEEQILVGAKSGTTLSSLTRGYANSGAKAHTASSTCFVRHDSDPVLLDEANQLAAVTTTVGGMAYYDGSKWMPIAPGTQGMVLTEGASPTFVPAWVLDAMFALFNNAGEIPVGAADNTPQMLAAPGSTGLVLVSNTGASLKMAWAQIPTAGYTDLSVTQAKLADGVINSAKMAGNYAVIFQQASAPAAPIRPGSLWFNTGNNLWYRCTDGTTWVAAFGSAYLTGVGCLAISNPFTVNANTNTYFRMNWNIEGYDPLNMFTVGQPFINIPADLGGLWNITIFVQNAGPSSGLQFQAHSSDGTVDSVMEFMNPARPPAGDGGHIYSGTTYLPGAGIFYLMVLNTDTTQAAQFNCQATLRRISG